MKKLRIAVASLIVCAAAIVSYNAYSNSQATSTLMLENIEALAAGEGGGGGGMCFSQYKMGNGKSRVLRCGTCDWAVGVGTRVGGSC